MFVRTINLYKAHGCIGLSAASPMLTSRGSQQDYRSFRKLHFSTPRPVDVVFKSRFPDVNVPLETITEFCFKNSDKYANRKALVDGITHKYHTYAETVELIHKSASALTRHGLVAGDTAMFISPNCMEYVIFYHAVICLGGTVTFINPSSPLDDMVTQAKDSRPKYIWASPDLAERTKDLARIVGDVQTIFCDGDSETIPASSLLTDNGSRHPGYVPIDVLNKVAMLPYSSGTTGFPKGVMLTHHNEVANCLQGCHPAFNLGGWEEGAVQPAVLPMYHMFATWAYFIYGMFLGHTIVTLPRFEPDSFLGLFKNYKPNLLFTVPPVILFLNRHPEALKADLSCLRRVAVGAAPLGKDSESELKQRCPEADINQIYGLSETSPAISSGDVSKQAEKTGSIGEIIGNTEAKLIDPETEQSVGIGKPGELWIRGPQVMKGYLNKPEETKNSIDPEGWFKTGDIMHRDEDNYLYVTDRLKELIKYKGFQVPPAELEAILCSHPDVADAGVIGVPDMEAGELPRAYVELKPGATVLQNDLIKLVSDKVAPYKKIRGGLEILHKIPRSASGKILRRELKSLVL